MPDICRWWYAYAFDNPLRRLLHPPERVLGPYVREGMTALDVGCGMGHFTVGMARMVGDGGRVIAADVQQKMLDITTCRLRRAGMSDRVQTHLCEPDRLGVEQVADFALAFWMLHESPDCRTLLEQLHAALKPGGTLYVAEPPMHVTEETFAREIADARSVGFDVPDPPDSPPAFCRVAVFRRSS